MKLVGAKPSGRSNGSAVAGAEFVLAGAGFDGAARPPDGGAAPQAEPMTPTKKTRQMLADLDKASRPLLLLLRSGQSLVFPERLSTPGKIRRG
jgi:hypothetical protein